MPEQFVHVAIDGAGRRQRGVSEAASAQAVFERLKAEGLTPISVKSAGKSAPLTGKASTLGDRDVTSLVLDLSTLLEAGSDVRTALGLVGGVRAKPSVRAVAQAIAREVSGGEGVDVSLARHLGPQHAFIAALAAAGEASGDLVGGLRRGGDLLETRIRMRDQMASILAYPLFVLATAVAALLIILTLVVPAIAPLAEAPGASPGLAMQLLLGASNFLRESWLLVLVALGLAVAGVAIGWIGGPLKTLVDRLFLEGPARRTAADLVYGGFAIALGGILSAGAPPSEAMRLSLRSVRSVLAKARLDPTIHAVRQGERLSAALARVPNFPEPISRLAMIGEESGTLGEMLVKSGHIAEQAALRRIEAAGRLIGPALIVLLGGLIGLLMAGLLSGVTGLGDAALQ